jgi:hypothetical protein
MIYGSGLRSGDANIGTVPSYTQFNVGIARTFLLPNDPMPMTVRFDVVNLFDAAASSSVCRRSSKYSLGCRRALARIRRLGRGAC